VLNAIYRTATTGRGFGARDLLPVVLARMLGGRVVCGGIRAAKIVSAVEYLPLNSLTPALSWWERE